MFDETGAKAFLMTGAKVINIVVNYSSKMEMPLAKMRKLMTGLHSAALQPRALDMSKFPEILAAEILHGLSTPMEPQWGPPAFPLVQDQIPRKSHP